MNSKLAGQQGTKDQQFEQGFFQLAYDKLQSKLYNLLPFLVGFELVKKSPDGSKSVGVFGFKSNSGQVLFVPAFFINGKVKDMDLMYSKNNNQFFPLEENFAELFLKDDVTSLGTPGDENRQQIRSSNPPKSYRQMIQPPLTGRMSYASDNSEDFDREAFKKAEIQSITFDDFIEVKVKEAHTTLVDFLSEADASTRQVFWKIAESNPSFLESVYRFYSPEELAGALSKNATELLVDPALKVVTFSETNEAIKLDDEGKKKLFKDGYAIVDKRKHEDKSKFGLVKYEETFSNPTCPGFYPYLTELGLLRYGLVLIKPLSFINGFSNNNAIVIDLEAKKSGQAYIVPANQVFVKDQLLIADFKSVYDQLEEPAEGLPGWSKDYILINEELQCTQPFNIAENYKDPSGVRRLKISPINRFDTGYDSLSNSQHKNKTPDPILVFTKKKGFKLEYKNNFVYVPKGYKLFQIYTSCDYYESIPYDAPVEEKEKKEKERQEERSRVKAGRPGCFGNLSIALAERNFLPFTLSSNGSDYFASVAEAKKKHYPNVMAAKIGMVTDFGLDEKQAEDLVNRAIPGKVITGTIKLAVTGEYQHTLVDEAPYTNQLGQETYQGLPFYEVAPRDDSYTGDPTQIGFGTSDVGNDTTGNNYQPGNDPQQNVNHANQLAEGGQKEIFDTQAIATIAKYSDPQSKITEYVPSFTSSLDKLGRILFMFSWATEKMQDIYGKDQLSEFKELLTSVFNGLGDLIIFLKRQNPDLSINNSEADNAGNI